MRWKERAAISRAILKTWPLKRYPYLVFYVERDHHVDVWRLLRAERDIPAWLWEPADVTK